jgi:hypothetical protein
MNTFGRFIGAIVALGFILIGAVLLLGNLGFLMVDPIEVIVDFWPGLLILLGLYFIWMFARPRRRPEGVALAETLESAKKADLTFDFGAGELNVYPLEESDNLFQGTFSLKPEKRVSRAGDMVKVRLGRSEWLFPPFTWSRDDWRLGLTTVIPLTLHINTGACRVVVDLTENLVELVELNTGASDVSIQFPRASGFTRAVIKGGAANIRLVIPSGVAAAIKSTGALGSLNVDEKRFPRTNGSFASPDFESAQNKVDIEISTGVSSVTIS